MQARNPRLVFAELHGFGEQGPYAGAPAYDDIIQALSGAADLVLRQTGEPGYFPTVAADKISGMLAVQAVIAALFQRERTGLGQVIEVPMFETVTSFLMIEHFYARHLAEGDAAQPEELGYPRSLTPWRRPYRTADGYACIMPYTNENWRRFFEAIGRADLARDERFTSIAARSRHVAELLAIAGEIVRSQPTDHWLALCERLDIPCARLNRLEDLEHDPHLQAVEFFQRIESPEGGPSYRFPRFPVRMSRSAVPPTMPPRLGQHTHEVLSTLALSADVRGRLLARREPAIDRPRHDEAAPT
jgi:crotonobetainyl-CoA:carnitine CoA-transferase CaiB-like acyl-CoA transferase